MFEQWRLEYTLGLVLGTVVGACTSGSAKPSDEAGTPSDNVPSEAGSADVDASAPRPSAPADGGGVDVDDEASAPQPPAPADGCPRLAAQGTEPLLDDFEASGSNIAAAEGRAGQWLYYDDGSGGQQTVEFVEDGSGVLHVRSSGWTIWGSGFGATLSPASTLQRLCPYDVSAYSGLSFRVRGLGRVRLRLAMPENTPVAEGGTCTKAGDWCYDWPGTWFNLTDEWQTHELPFCALHPEGWSGAAPEFDPTQLGAIHFQLDGTVELWLDDLSFMQSDESSDAGMCDFSFECPLEAASPSAELVPEETWLELSSSLTLHTFDQETTSCGPLRRRYLSYVPTGLEQPSTAPVLMALHGSGANAESFQDLMARGRLDQLAERDGFIVVYGNAAPGTHTQPQVPNSGAWRQDYFDDGQVDDVDYLLRVLDDLEQRGVTAGDNQVYLTGLSNGGGMVLDAARRLPERFAGIAPFMAFDGMEPRSVPNLDGTGLTRVIFGYAPGDPGLPPEYDPIISELPAQWGRALGISNEVMMSPVEAELDDVVVEGEDYEGTSPAALATLDSRVTQRDFFDPTNDARLRVLIFDSAGHFWPNPIQDTEDWILDRWGLRNQDVDASDAVWEFFRADLER